MAVTRPARARSVCMQGGNDAHHAAGGRLHHRCVGAVGAFASAAVPLRPCQCALCNTRHTCSDTCMRDTHPSPNRPVWQQCARDRAAVWCRHQQLDGGPGQPPGAAPRAHLPHQGGVVLRAVRQREGALHTCVLPRKPCTLTHAHPGPRLLARARRQGEPSCVAQAVFVITAAVDRYKELCEGRYSGEWQTSSCMHAELMQLAQQLPHDSRLRRAPPLSR
jgi:hypothetical protein